MQSTPLLRRALAPAPAPSLEWARARRAFMRQAAPFAIAAIAVTGLGALAEIAAGADWASALGLWAWLGPACALAIVVIRELGRSPITSLASLGRHRGYAVLGAAPELTAMALRQLPPDARSPLGALALQPASEFAAAFRHLQGAVAADRLVAFIAPRANDGATTAALGAAISATQQGRRALVIDCDLRRRSLTRALLGEEPAAGVFEAAERPDAWRELVMQEPETGLAFLPAAALRNPWRTLYGAPGFDALLRQAREAYDLVILDCPPALGNAEGAMIARLAHKCVLVASWDDTPLAAVRMAMRTLRTRSRVTTGLYVNRVPPGYRFGRVRPL